MLHILAEDSTRAARVIMERTIMIIQTTCVIIGATSTLEKMVEVLLNRMTTARPTRATVVLRKEFSTDCRS